MYPRNFYTTYTETIAVLCKEYEYAQIEDTSSHVEVDTANGIVRAVDPVEASVLRDQHYAITRMKLGRLDNLLARELTATKEYSQIIDSLRPYVDINEMQTRYEKGYLDSGFINELEFQLLHDDVSYVHSNNTSEIEDFFDYLKNQSYYGVQQIYEEDTYGTTICIDAKNRFYVTKPSSVVFQNAENLVEKMDGVAEVLQLSEKYEKMSAIVKSNQTFEEIKASKEIVFEKFYDDELDENENYQLMLQNKEEIYKRNELIQETKKYISDHELYWHADNREIIIHAYDDHTIFDCTDKLQHLVEQRILSGDHNALDLTVTYHGDRLLGKTTVSENELNRYYSMSHLNHSSVLAEAVKDMYADAQEMDEEMLEDMAVSIH